MFSVFIGVYMCYSSSQQTVVAGHWLRIRDLSRNFDCRWKRESSLCGAGFLRTSCCQPSIECCCTWFGNVFVRSVQPLSQIMFNNGMQYIMYKVIFHYVESRIYGPANCCRRYHRVPRYLYLILSICKGFASRTWACMTTDKGTVRL